MTAHLATNSAMRKRERERERAVAMTQVKYGKLAGGKIDRRIARCDVRQRAYDNCTASTGLTIADDC